MVVARWRPERSCFAWFLFSFCFLFFTENKSRYVGDSPSDICFVKLVYSTKPPRKKRNKEEKMANLRLILRQERSIWLTRQSLVGWWYWRIELYCFVFCGFVITTIMSWWSWYDDEDDDDDDNKNNNNINNTNNNNISISSSRSIENVESSEQHSLHIFVNLLLDLRWKLKTKTDL